MFEGFETDFEKWLEPDNRWVVLSKAIPWEELSAAYEMSLSTHTGRPAKDGRLVTGAVIIKHQLSPSDEETILQIRENPYLQYFVGFTAFHKEQAFAPSLFVEIRRRMGPEVFAQFEDSIIARMSDDHPFETSADDHQMSPPGSGDTGLGDEAKSAPADDKPTTHRGKLIVDATVVEQAIRYPTDLSLLNEAREISEAIIDSLHPLTGMKKKVRTYRRNARSDCLALVKQRRPNPKKRRKAIGRQLRYLNRNLGHIDAMLDLLPGLDIPLATKQLRRYWIIRHLYDQQKQMFDNRTRRCDDRIVSIHQPHVRPIVRGKQNKAVEFGAKLGVSLNGNGIACVDHLSWDAYHEGHDLPGQVEVYKKRHGYYPEKVLADPLYGTRDNRKFLKEKGIEFAGKLLGRPPKMTRAEDTINRRQRQQDYRERIPIEGKFGQGKNGYNLNYIRAKTAKTSEAWIRSIFPVMNLLVLIRSLCLCITKLLYCRLMSALIMKIGHHKENITAAITKLQMQRIGAAPF